MRDIYQAKHELEKNIGVLVSEYVRETGTKVSSIDPSWIDVRTHGNPEKSEVFTGVHVRLEHDVNQD